jgi:hypothetical protein
MMPQQRTVSALSMRIEDPDRHLGILQRSDATLYPVANRLRNHIRTEFDTRAPSITRISRDTVWRS